MPSGVLDIVIEQGATFRKLIQWRDNADLPIDLTDVTEVVGQVRPKQQSDSKVDFTMTIQEPRANGEILWEMAADVSETLSHPEVQFYDIEAHWSNGDVTRILQGVARINQEVTR